MFFKRTKFFQFLLIGLMFSGFSAFAGGEEGADELSDRDKGRFKANNKSLYVTMETNLYTLPNFYAAPPTYVSGSGSEESSEEETRR